jgi:hypothetical protein
VAYKLDDSRGVTPLFFAHVEAVDIYTANFDVVLMDCTYRSNRFNMPLLNIVGVTGTNTTIHLAQCFMKGETLSDYEWALEQLKNLQNKFRIPGPQVFFVDRDLALLNALEAVYPAIPAFLCLWHIMKDVQAHARRSFPKELDEATMQPRDSAAHQTFCETFVRVMEATTEDDYKFRLQELHYLSPVETAYVEDVWLDIWKFRIVRFWTDNVVHFGMRATSRVEGYHATLKKWLGSSTGDFLTIHTRMEHWWRQTIRKHRKLLSDADIYLPTRLQRPLFADVTKVVHQFALARCLQSYQQISRLLNPCSRRFSRSMEMPCTHQLHTLAESGSSLQPNHFHQHWWIRRIHVPPTTQANILKPAAIRDRRAARALQRRNNQHTAGSGPRGTRRIPSLFEE